MSFMPKKKKKKTFQGSSFPPAFLSEGGDNIKGKEEMVGTGLKPQETITHPHC